MQIPRCQSQRTEIRTKWAANLFNLNFTCFSIANVMRGNAIDISMANEQKKKSNRKFNLVNSKKWSDEFGREGEMAWCVFENMQNILFRAYVNKYRKNARRLAEAVSIIRAADGCAYICMRHRLSGIIIVFNFEGIKQTHTEHKVSRNLPRATV